MTPEAPADRTTAPGGLTILISTRGSARGGVLDGAGRQTDVLRMRAILVLALLLAGAAAAEAGDRNVLAPYRFEPAPQTLSPVEQQRALDYRNQVQSQLRELEQERRGGVLRSPRAERRLMDTRSELGRINRILEP